MNRELDSVTLFVRAAETLNMSFNAMGEENGWKSQDGCLADLQLDSIQGDERLCLWQANVLAQMLHAMISEQLAILPSTYAPRNLTGSLSVTRTIIELSGRLFYLVDPAATVREKGRRLINEELHSLYEVSRMRSNLGGDLGPLRKSARIWMERADGLGFDVTDNLPAKEDGSWRNASYAGSGRPGSRGVVDALSGERYKILYTAYQEASALCHGSGHMASFMTDAEHGWLVRFRATSLWSVFASVMIATTSYAAWYKWDLTDYLRETDASWWSLTNLMGEDPRR
jgi:hypothetical protein